MTLQSTSAHTVSMDLAALPPLHQGEPSCLPVSGLMDAARRGAAQICIAQGLLGRSHCPESSARYPCLQALKVSCVMTRGHRVDASLRRK